MVTRIAQNCAISNQDSREQQTASHVHVPEHERLLHLSDLVSAAISTRDAPKKRQLVSLEDKLDKTACPIGHSI